MSTQTTIYDELHRQEMHDDERVVTSEEIEQALDDARADGGVFNGCIDYYLHERFGDRVRHIMGFNWVLRP